MIGRSVDSGDGAEVGDRLARVGLVDHRRQDHQAVDADPLRIGREPARQRGRALGDAAQHRDPPGDVLDRRTQDLELLGVLQRAVLADRAQHDQPVDARFDHLVEMGHRRRRCPATGPAETGSWPPETPPATQRSSACSSAGTQMSAFNNTLAAAPNPGRSRQAPARRRHALAETNGQSVRSTLSGTEFTWRLPNLRPQHPLFNLGQVHR